MLLHMDGSTHAWFQDERCPMQDEPEGRVCFYRSMSLKDGNELRMLRIEHQRAEWGRPAE
jgi:hypothetical protein